MGFIIFSILIRFENFHNKMCVLFMGTKLDAIKQK